MSNDIYLEKQEDLEELTLQYQRGEVSAFEYATRKRQINEDMAYYGLSPIDEHHNNEVNSLNS